jgi:hypothetical protein
VDSTDHQEEHAKSVVIFSSTVVEPGGGRMQQEAADLRLDVNWLTGISSFSKQKARIAFHPAT